MDVPLEIRFHNMDPSDAIEARVRERVEKLNKLYDQLVACRVSIEAPHKQHRKGNVFTVHVDMSVPGHELVVSHGPHHPQEKYRDPDLYTVLNEVFEAAERQLVEFKRRQRGEVKNHRPPGGGSLPAEG
ncbi:MAG TPA: HPF/RaiA family ribosome-associated protein [Alphaproteobacteria bacterium]|jgi:ribosomal subunit interface protein|nr:HPF/RaiA family ribosome-associated protein [Alphaproteobacteria bacterium]